MDYGAILSLEFVACDVEQILQEWPISFCVHCQYVGITITTVRRYSASQEPKFNSQRPNDRLYLEREYVVAIKSDGRKITFKDLNVPRMC